uniref:Uncharacterized protein n=1 Tax=Faxonius propinquus nudivirus TaxID=3139431 RepID=A0AAU8GBF5_9VIRU
MNYLYLKFINFGIGGLPQNVLVCLDVITKKKIYTELHNLLNSNIYITKTNNSKYKLKDIDIFIVYNIYNKTYQNFKLIYFDNINLEKSLIHKGIIVCTKCYIKTI